ncbi:hypothetical protein B0187_09840 [Haemophilus paracuniculus]|uniref:Uncharacterized protein n=1 Tax=Haemophilus paracuniculus TaxID=734 RepID=A0A1T0AQ52_9PAST|nr:hypothetical protein [Haemophilus paracuniculus]OOR98089.1 hypothetical protein B0187_09840 [Haemophilus paracuniculus]
MAITSAVQNGNFVYAYKPNSQPIVKTGQLYGYTANSVSIKEGFWISTYDENGKLISRTAAR